MVSTEVQAETPPSPQTGQESRTVPLWDTIEVEETTYRSWTKSSLQAWIAFYDSIRVAGAAGSISFSQSREGSEKNTNRVWRRRSGFRGTSYRGTTPIPRSRQSQTMLRGTG